jgi:hypothetical protein
LTDRDLHPIGHLGGAGRGNPHRSAEFDARHWGTLSVSSQSQCSAKSLSRASSAGAAASASRQAIEARAAVGLQERLTKEQIRAALDELGGSGTLLPAAEPSVRAKVYASLGIRLDYDHAARRITASAADVCVHNRVRRGT